MRNRIALTAVAAGALLAVTVTAPISSVSAKPRPELSFTVSSLHFSVPSDLPSGVKPELTIRLINSGQSATGAVKLALLRESLEDPALQELPFQIVDENCPRSLGPQRTCSVTVRFTPPDMSAEPSSIRPVALNASAAGATASLVLTATVRDDTLPTEMEPPCLEGWGKCIVGTEGADYTYGSVFADQQYGLGGNDDLHGSSGEDFIQGGDGNDTIHGNIAFDYLKGGRGADRLYGGDGNDTLQDWGDSSGDTNDADTFSGGDGTDLCEISGYATRQTSTDTVLDCEQVSYRYNY